MSLRLTFSIPEGLLTPERVQAVAVEESTEAASTVVTVSETVQTVGVWEERVTTRLEGEL